MDESEDSLSGEMRIVAGSSLSGVLVSDRELAPLDPDRFRHEDIVAQLADLATQVEPPANIALYGPWGSGKSSISNHLGAELQRRKAPVKFVRYDAFKYAKVPLQRHFIRYLATTLGVKDDRFSRGLYEDRSTNDLRLAGPNGGAVQRLFELAGVVLLILTVATVFSAVLAAVLALLISWIADDSPFAATFWSLLRPLTLGLVAPAGLFAVFSEFAGRGLTVQRSRSAPETEEQFAALFDDLVDRALKGTVSGRKRFERLIVVIDELDRCDARTVVETLDSLRSFLDSPKCVFIVSADQQVLETALTTHVRQATPSVQTNPYYSAGSEYLDKTFHYQISIPPLLPRRLSGFAAELVRDRGGVWQEIESIDRVVSVLIPNHVRSPRRAKTLLNSFALLFELARRRCEVGHLAGDPSDRAEEIAVLACLRVEFPLFASELREHPRLVDACRSIIDGETNRPDRVQRSTWMVANQFVSGKRPLDVLIADDSVGPSAEVSTSHDDSDESDDSLVAVQSQQLKAYLRKTSYVHGPTRDLVHLESSGARFGLDPIDGDTLEEAASQGDFEAVLLALDSLGSDRTAGALTLAESLDRDVPPLGHERDNLITIILRLYADERWVSGATIASKERVKVRDAFDTAVSGHARSYRLRAADLPGAFALAVDSSNDHLLSAVLAHEEADGHEALTRLLIPAYPKLRDLHRSDSIQIIGTSLLSSHVAEASGELIAELETDVALELVSDLRPSLTEHLQSIAASIEADSEDEEEESSDELQVESERLLGLFRFDPAILEVACVAVLAVDHHQTRDAVSGILDDLQQGTGTTEFAPLSEALVAVAQKREALAIPRWLRPVRPDHLTDSVRSQMANKLATKLWTALTRSDEMPDYAFDAAELIAGLAPSDYLASKELVQEIRSALDASISAVTTDEIVCLEAVGLFERSGLLSRSDALSAVSDLLDTTLAATIPATPGMDDNTRRLVTKSIELLAVIGGEDEAVKAVDALDASQWYTDPDRLLAKLCLVNGVRSRNQALESPVTADDLLAGLEDDDGDLGEAVAEWLVRFRPAPSDGARIVDILFRSRPTSRTKGFVEDYANQLGADRLVLVVPEIGRAIDEDPRIDLLRAVGLPDSPSDGVAESLVFEFAKATNMDQRKRFLDIWREAAITEDSARLRLIQQVLLPTAKSGAGGIKLAIKSVDLWKTPPHGAKGALRDVRKIVPDDLRRSFENALVEAGLVKRERTLLGFGPEVLRDLK